MKPIFRTLPALALVSLLAGVGSCSRAASSKAGSSSAPSKSESQAAPRAGNACERELLTPQDVAGVLSDPIVGTKNLNGDPQTCYFITGTTESAGGPELMVSLRPGLGVATIGTYTSGKMNPYAEWTPLKGVGDGAVWLPALHEVVAQKDNALCDIQTLQGLNKNLRTVEAQQMRLGDLCNKIFAGIQPAARP